MIHLSEIEKNCAEATLNTNPISLIMAQANAIKRDLPACLKALREARGIIEEVYRVSIKWGDPDKVAIMKKWLSEVGE